MTARRRRRVGYSVLAGLAFGAAGWWSDWAGYDTAGTVLGVSAGAAVLAGSWRTGALHLSWPADPPLLDAAAPTPGEEAGAVADRERSVRLLYAIDAAAGGDGSGRVGELSEFERIVLHGLARAPGRPYPPPGHGYPRP